jgi:hypothetical protein
MERLCRRDGERHRVMRCTGVDAVTGGQSE